ncbi:MAG TPA: class I SAM-dependent methyltransferase [Candidatus Hodarchaeales archaeon]|uniref:Methyltransferase domain-containing protein n=2 Tax=Candidatus Chisholmiibacteriota TaxID=1817900 RepID=A0A1G1VP02_9BACT|nr:MAG: hypothetical protein A2785_02420 [Candidatus Chisholmbacteria bacterium RIFCSPHIGHO2_01_FULL_49_18]OGY21571.1 MAG: hypothetical protein A3A65_05635 [Candidatus Chisholmbacteria bacterium RIFCSPLOWO2_01_FULL_49_14]HKZ42278.1 class I SAM-dependent methyltransferase [Candidatus Hodarchaeales archaeon]
MFLLKNLLKNLKTRLYWILKGPYNPREFWQRWGETFVDEPMQRKIYKEHHWIIKKLKEQNPKTILEVGCGFGRNIRFIAENYPLNKDTGSDQRLEIVGADFSDSMLTSAGRFLKGLDQSRLKITTKKTDVTNLPFKESSFDTVLSHGVLMHIKPDDIKKAVAEMVRVARKYIILIEQNDNSMPLKNRSFQKMNYFSYAYPYKKLLTDQGAQIIEYHRTQELDWFVARV